MASVPYGNSGRQRVNNNSLLGRFDAPSHQTLSTVLAGIFHYCIGGSSSFHFFRCVYDEVVLRHVDIYLSTFCILYCRSFAVVYSLS